MQTKLDYDVVEVVSYLGVASGLTAITLAILYFL